MLRPYLWKARHWPRTDAIDSALLRSTFRAHGPAQRQKQAHNSGNNMHRKMAFLDTLDEEHR